MTFAPYHQGDGKSLKDTPKTIMKSLQICILKDLFGSRGEAHGRWCGNRSTRILGQRTVGEFTPIGTSKGEGGGGGGVIHWCRSSRTGGQEMGSRHFLR